MTDTARLVDADSSAPRLAVTTSSEAQERAFLDRLRTRVLGSSATIPTPTGETPLRYFDFIASGRFHADVEEELAEKVLPFMANTHTESNHTGRLMTRYYEAAFAKIASYVGASKEDVLIPVGSGSTGAINRLIYVLGLRIPDQLEERHHLTRQIPENARPVIFRSMMEHHSNDIAWRETIGDSVYVDFDAAGRISVEDLDAKLESWKHRPWKIGTFSAASNVTGILNDVHALARVLHRHGALAFFDFAAAGPYVDVDMNPAGDPGRAARRDLLLGPQVPRRAEDARSPRRRPDGSSRTACRPSREAEPSSTRRPGTTGTCPPSSSARRAALRRSSSRSRPGSRST